MTSLNDISPAAAAELKEWGGRVLLLVFRTIPAPLILSVVVWQSFKGPLSAFSCSLEASRLFRLWPRNSDYLTQLQNSQFTPDDKCWFFAVTSTVSVLYLCWLLWLIVSCVLVVKNIQHVPGTAKYILPKIVAAILACVVGLAVAVGLMFIERFEPTRDIHLLSTLLPIGWSAFKVVFFVIPYSYFVLGATLNLLVLFVRYLIYQFRER